MYTPKKETINLINLVTQESLLLSEKGNSYILDGLPDWDYVSANINYVGFVSQLGAQKTNTQLETRPIRINGWIIANSEAEMKRKKSFLNKFINPFQDMRCEYENYFIDFTPDKSVKYNKDYLKNNSIMCNFEIEGTCGLPLFSNIQQTLIIQSPSYPVPLFPMTISSETGTILGRTGEGSRRVIENTGTVETGFELEIVATEEAITNPKISLGEPTELSIKVLVVLEVGDKLLLSTQYGQEFVKIVRSSGEEIDFMVNLTRDSELFLLNQGENIITLTDDNGPLELVDFTIKFSPLFMEIQ